MAMDTDKSKSQCGVVMPISAIDGCSENHWADVQEILFEAIDASGFEPNLVSHADDVGIIHKRIIQNLYENPVVVCDVSGKNPNVMFELGLRLAFDKPTIIVKDEKTSYSFDTSAIEHIEYPRDLRFSQIVEFKKRLSEKIQATHTKATTDPNYTTFLKHFGEFKVAKIDEKEVSGQEFILEELKFIRRQMQRIDRGQSPSKRYLQDRLPSNQHDICLENYSPEEFEEVASKVAHLPNITEMHVRSLGPKHKHIMLTLTPDSNPLTRSELRQQLDIQTKPSGSS